nr:hypothetical protein [uncultured Campylobacter sp.]
MRCELKRAISGLGTARKRSALFPAPARFANSVKFLGEIKVKFKRFGILKFCESEWEQAGTNKAILRMEFRIKFYEAAGGLNFKIRPALKLRG